MGAEVEPVVGRWYQRVGKGQIFRVVDVDETAGSIAIQHFDGDVEQFELGDWEELEIEPIEEPEDWTGPLDAVETDDLDYSETDMSRADWREAVEEQHVCAQQPWQRPEHNEAQEDWPEGDSADAFTDFTAALAEPREISLDPAAEFLGDHAAEAHGDPAAEALRIETAAETSGHAEAPRGTAPKGVRADATWSPRELAQMRHRLLDREAELRADIRRELEKYDAEQYIALVGRVADPGERSVADLVSDLDLAEITRDIEEIRMVEAALLRLAQGRFGACVDCGMMIPPNRLQCAPAVGRCVACQERVERRDERSRHRKL